MFGQKPKSVEAPRDLEKERREQERKDTNELLESLAQAQVPVCQGQQPAWLARYVEDHEKDVAAYSFDCKKHGDFLTLFVTRLMRNWWANSIELEKLSTSINLAKCKEIKLIHGHLPDLLGEGKFTFRMHTPGGGWSSGTGDGNYKAPEGYQWVVSPPEYRDPYRSIFHLASDEQSQRGENYFHDNSYEITTIIPKAARSAADDKISFAGVGVLDIPAGLGEKVNARILSELEVK